MISCYLSKRESFYLFWIEKMEQDDYLLFRLLDDGEAHTITYSGKTYTFQFMGERIGSENYLSVKASSGEEKRFGWGWSGEQVWRALEHLKMGGIRHRCLATDPTTTRQKGKQAQSGWK